MRGFCHLVDPIDQTQRCEAPAGFRSGSGIYHGHETVATTCYSCGMFVCKTCSSKIPWHGRIRRICGSCQEESSKDGSSTKEDLQA